MGSESTNKEIEKVDKDEISLKELILQIKDWLAYFKTKLKIILISSIVGGVLGLIIAWNEKPMYIAQLTFAMEEDKGSSGGASSIASSLGIDVSASGGAFASSNLTEFMKSRLIIEKVLLSPVVIEGKIISFADYYIKINNLKENWKHNHSLKDLSFPSNSDRSNFSLQQDSILKELYNKLIDKKSLNITQKDKKSTITTVEFTSNHEFFSKLFCEKLIEETTNYYIQTKSKKSKNNVAILQKQVDSLRKKLNLSINSYGQAKDNVFNLNPAYEIKVSEPKKKEIDVQSNITILTSLVIQLESAKVTLRKETPLIQLIDKPILPLTKVTFGKLNSFMLGFFIFAFSFCLYFTISRLYNNIIK
jgi:uncharacterized protein involved in exopolysaccharide biosynthesis